MSIRRDCLSMAGEYAVASEICRRNLYAQVTLGHLKRTDILVYNSETEKELRIEVKAKQEREWPGQKGITSEDARLIFVDFQDKNKKMGRPDFYVLDSQDWRQFVDEIVKASPKIIRIEKSPGNYYPIHEDGYKGTGVKASQIVAHKEKWEKLLGKLKS